MIYCANTKSTDRVTIEQFLPLEDDEQQAMPDKAYIKEIRSQFEKAMKPKVLNTNTNAKLS